MTTEALNEQGRSVKVMNSDPPKGCQEIGLIAPGINECGSTYYVVWATFATPEGLRNCLRNMTAEKGGNYFRLEAPRSGTAFKCPAGAIEGLPEPPPAAPIEGHPEPPQF
jgi:hypothetical protein